MIRAAGELKVDWWIVSFFLKDVKNQFVVTVTSQSLARVKWMYVLFGMVSLKIE
jgi:hypothetical protein